MAGADGPGMAYVYLALLLALVPGASFAAVRAWQASQRSRGLEQFALDHGLQHYDVDPFGLIDHAFDLFCLGDRPQVRNIVAGLWDGIEVRGADLWFSVPTRSSDRGLFELSGRSIWDFAHHTGRAFSFATVEVDAVLPHISIRRRGEVETAAARLEPGSLRFESDRFNHRYDVRCEDREYAWQFVDIRLMQWLLDLSDSKPAMTFEAGGNRLLVHCRQLRPPELVLLFRATRRFHDLVPQMVLRRFPLVVRPG
jgi:hypothetical protein